MRITRWDTAAEIIKQTRISQSEVELLEEAVAKQVDLSHANLPGYPLSGANLNRARLADACLSGADLDHARLAGANLAGAVLSRADLSRADLSGANLSGADLAGAILVGADLSGAELIGANLAGADLSYSSVASANRSGADLSNVRLLGCCELPLSSPQFIQSSLRRAMLDYRARHPNVPIVDDLDRRILDSITSGGALDMDAWHTCDTTHCRAGWAIHLAGNRGYALENSTDAAEAGAAIYLASTGRLPNFFASHDRALQDIAAWAALAAWGVPQ